MDRGAWWATVHGIAKSWTLLSDFHALIIIIMHYMVILLSNYYLTYSHNHNNNATNICDRTENVYFKYSFILYLHYYYYYFYTNGQFDLQKT